MEKLHHYFKIQITDEHYKAQIHCNDTYNPEQFVWTEKDILYFLNEQKVAHGIDKDVVQLLTTNISPEKFPLTIAIGIPVIHGENGTITYKSSVGMERIKDPHTHFRDVMKIPMVEKGQKLATITEPTKGTDGIDVYGNIIPAKPGNACPVKAGNNVVYREKDYSFYAATKGQLIVANKKINVEDVYEIYESLSMKRGNLDFNGSIVIHGDVPTGYTVKAKEDIKIFGIVEGATLIAGNSVFISEGMAGLKKGVIHAEGDIHIGYVNQGSITAGGSIHVNHSIIHSECIATDHLYIEHGNIIGGSVSAGKSIEAKDIGNQMNTKTEIMFGMNESIHKRENKLLTEKKELETSLKKLMIIGDRLAWEQDTMSAKKRVIMLRQRNSFLQTSRAIQEVDTALDKLYAAIGDEYEAVLKINRQLHENVQITFGKYKRNIHSLRQNVKLLLIDKEIVLRDLE